MDEADDPGFRGPERLTLPPMGAADAPLDTWTVLFTDLVASTQLRMRLGEDAFDDLRAVHDRIVTAELTDHGAVVVKGLGDGFMAGFRGTGAALACAIGTQQSIDEYNRTAQDELGVRVGISVGDAVFSDGDLHGRAVVEAGRLCAAAGGGEILCSEPVRAVAASRGSAAFGESRPFDLKGFPQPVMACSVAWEPRPYDAVSRGLHFATLGPLAVTDTNGPVGVGGPKERLVLALLLARANVAVGIDAIVDAVWGDRPPRTAERTVHAYVARLRSALEPGRPRGTPHEILTTEGRGYRLAVLPEGFDALRFEQLATQGAAQLRRGDERAAATLRTALDLWRGDAFAGFADVDACAAEARRLDELRVAALEDRVDADLQAGGARELVAELDVLVGAHPFRERLWGQLMLALYRDGRQRDALAAYQRARAVLIDELGIEPGPELRRLEAAILAQDPVLDARRPDAPAAPLGLPLALQAVGPAFVGRASELARLRAAWERAAAGQGGLVSVVGPEGIGKTRLAAEVGREAHEGGGVVLYGRCDHAHRGARALLDLTLRSGGLTLSAIDPVDGDDLAGAVARFLPTWTQGRPALVVLDDLHLADTDALDVVAELAEWCQAGPVLVIAAFRADAEPLTTEDAGGASDSASIVLGGLDRDAVSSICELYAPDGWADDELGRLYDVTGGVPLQIHEHASDWARTRAVLRAGEAADRVTGARARLNASRDEIADSVEGIQLLLERRRAHLAGRQVHLDAPGRTDACPYKGLARFEQADAANFFGRERLVAELVALVPGSRLLAVVGPSGSGKSSLVRAGLLPALAQGVLPGTDDWQTVTLRPGAAPGGELDRGLRMAREASAARRVLFVDQFEELFTLCGDDAERDEFVHRVVEVATSGTVVVLAVRADQFGRCAAYPELADLVAGNDVLVGPMRDAELRRAIQRPAERAGLTLEPGLVEVIVADVAGRAGALPLLSTALAETWERRRDSTLTLAGYRGAGGVNGALARMAEDAYLALDPGPRARARRVLLRLCEVGDDGTADLRRRLPLDEAAPRGDADARTTLETLAERRLLIIDGAAVEVAHEALLREWPRLRTWLDEDVQGRRLHRRLGEAARAWQGAGEEPSELYRGARLDAALDWAASHGADLDDNERAFIAASQDHAEAERRAAEERSRRQIRVNRSLRTLLAGAAVLLAVAVLAGSLAVRAASRARTAATAADARRVGAQALVTDDVDLSLLLAVEGVRLDDSPDTRANMLAALSRSPQVVASARGDEPVITVAVSPDGHLVAAGDPFAGVRFFDGETLELVGQYPEPPSNLAFRPQGDQLALTTNTFAVNSAGTGTLDPEPLVLVDPVTFERHATQPGDLPEGEVSAWAVDYSGDGRFLAASFDRFQGEDVESTVLVWDLEAPERPVARLETGKAVMTIRLSRDGSQLFVVTLEQPAVVVFDVETGEALRSAEGAPSLASWEYLELSPDGTVVAVIDGADIALLDAGTLEETGRLRGHSETVQTIEFANDGRTLVSGSADRVAIVWDVQSREPTERLVGHAGVIRAVGIDPAGATVFTGSLDRSVLSWDLVGRRRFVPRTHVVEPGFATLGIGEAIEGVGAGVALPAPGGGAVAFLENEGGGATRIQFLDAATGALGEAIDSGHGELGGAAWHPGLSRLATTGSDGVVRVWDARTEDVVAESEVAASHVSALDYSDDGRRIVFAQQPIVAAVDAETLEPVGRPVRLEQQVLGVFAGVDGTTALVVTDAPTVTLVDLARGTVVYEIDPGFAPWQADFAPDGGHAALAAFTGEVAVVDLETGELLGPPAVGHKETVINVSYSPDGDLFVTAGRDGRVALWDGRSGDPLGSVTPGRPNSGPNAEFLPDGRTVLIATRDGAVHTWDTSVAHWLDFACRVAGRNLTTDEWRDAFDDRPFRQTCPPR